MIFFHVVFLFPRHISLFFLPFRLYLLLSFSSQPCGFPSLMLTFNSSFFLLFQSLISQTCFYFWGFFVSFLSPFIFFFVYSSPFCQWYPKLYPLLWLCFLFYYPINVYKANIQEMSYTNMR